MRIVPAFDEGKHRLAGILGRMEGFSIQQFTFQGSEEALAQGIIETVANSTHGRSDARVMIQNLSALRILADK